MGYAIRIATPNFGDALGDAAWMTSMERNSELFVMAVRSVAGKRKPGRDAVAYRSDRLYAGTTSGFPRYRPRPSLPRAWERAPRKFDLPCEPAFLLLGYGELNENAAPGTRKRVDIDQPLSLINWNRWRTSSQSDIAAWCTFEATNTIDDPEAIRPTESTVSLSDSPWAHTVPPLSIE